MDTFPYANTRELHYHLSVGAAVVDGGGRLLVLRRATGVHLLPTETLEDGETLSQALARGLREEAGVVAELVSYMGATDMPFVWEGQEYEKTILWHELRLVSANEELRAPGDVESESKVLWLPLPQAQTLFAEQGRRLQDWDFSPVLARLRSA